MNYSNISDIVKSEFTAKITPKKILQGYGTWIAAYLNEGWDGYLMTLMFEHISGSSQEKIRVMHKEICRVYGKLASRVVRKPASPNFAHLLPRGVFFPDVPGLKKSKQELSDVTVNDGIHVHGIIVLPKNSRLKAPLDEHFHEKKRMYLRRTKIARIHVQPIVSDEFFVTDYAGKALKRSRFTGDEILVLPRTGKELTQKTATIGEVGTAGREIKDIMSAHNVSETIAAEICQAGSQKSARKQ
jgi:hypothetical protein